jgi:exopolyphosphatase/guanosine-5'-triphosphate,3'-diphosphate pyrophosphatase
MGIEGSLEGEGKNKVGRARRGRNRPRGRNHRSGPPTDGRVYSALDLGTNNCRLLIARRTVDGFKVIDAFSRIVRLGEGLGQADLGRAARLSDAAVERTLDALKVCADKIRRRGVTHKRNVATEACRRAVNGPSFLARVAAETGLELEVISTDEEARLATAGCVSLLDSALPRALLFDIGGGSTELIWLSVAPTANAVDGRDPAPEMLASISLPLGVVNLAERYGGRNVTPEAYAAMADEVVAALTGFDRTHGISNDVARGRVQMLGTSGTVTTLAGVHLDLRHYDRARIDGAFLDFPQMNAARDRLRAMSYEERVAHPCVGHERADLVIAGLAILDAIARLWPVGRLRVADRGLREGILIGLMRASKISADA